MLLKRNCVFCGKEQSLFVNDDAYDRYESGEEIQRAFPDLDSFAREFIISGMCYECQEKIFNKPQPCNKEAWGSVLGECACCGSPLYSKKNLTDDGKYKCPSCGSLHLYINERLVEELELE